MRTATVVAVLAALLPFAFQPAGASGSAPAAVAGGPYSIAEGDSLVLDGGASSDPENDPLTYTWDLDNDGRFDDASGVNVTVPWSDLSAIGVDDDGNFTVGLEVSDGSGTDTNNATLSVTNTQPTIVVTGLGVAVAGRPYQIRVSADDPGADKITNWTVTWGDGAVDSKRGKPGPINHKYDVVGLTHDITVSVVDEDGTWITSDVVVPYYDARQTLGRHDANTGTRIADFDSSDGSLDTAYAAVVGPDGLMYVSGNSSNTVERYDLDDNSYLGTFVAAGAGGLNGPRGLAFGPDGNLYVASSHTGTINRYNGSTGAFIDEFVEAGTLDTPTALSFASDASLIVADSVDDDLERYDSSTGGHLGTFATLPGGSSPSGLAWGPNGNLFVSLYSAASVIEVDASTGALVETFVSSGLITPAGLRFGPDGELWVADYWTDQIKQFDGSTGASLGTLITEPGAAGPRQFTFVPDHQVTVGESVPAPLTSDQWRNTMAPDLRSTPLAFEENIGQADTSLDFIARGKGYIAILTGGDAVLTLGNGRSGQAIRMSLAGGAADPAAAGVNSVSTDDPAIGPRFGSVQYAAVYPGIDVTYSANGRELEYSFVVAPGADPNDIKIEFDGVKDLTLDADGDLLIDSQAGPDLSSSAPITYQEVLGTRVPVTSSYVLQDDGTVGFQVGDYDPALPLIIDPTFKSVQTSTSASTTLTIAAPAGMLAGDVLVAQVTYRDAPPTITAPAGWVLIRMDFFSDRLTQWAYYKIATATEPADYTFTFSVADDSSGAIGAYSGVDTANPIDAHSGQGIDDTPAFTAPSITTTVANTTLIGLFGNRGGDAITPPPGMTERWDINGSSASEGADETFAGVGATGTRTASNPGKEKVAQLVALRPASLSVVNSTGDSTDSTPGDGTCDTGGTNSQGATECTLRAAIQEANALAGTDIINFNIPTTESGYSAAPLAYSITPSSAFPTITGSITIDGSTQPDFPGTPIVVLDGQLVAGDGLTINSGSGAIRSLVLHSFGGDGIEITSAGSNIVAGNYIGVDVTGSSDLGNGARGINVSGSSGNTIGGLTVADRNVVSGNDLDGVALLNGAADNLVVGNYIGTNASGTASLGNTDDGVEIRDSADNTIGGTTAAARNVISGNEDGVDLEGATSTGNNIRGNYIGTDLTGAFPLGHKWNGIHVFDGPSGNSFGGIEIGAGNLFAFNGNDGIAIESNVAGKNSILGNTFNSNSQLGIDLDNDTVTANDAGDGDAGPNDLLNYPVTTSAAESGGTVTVDFDLDVPAGTYRVEAFTNPSGADPTGFGEGEVFETAQTIVHTGSGPEPFQLTYTGTTGDIVTLTTTEDLGGGSYGSTSEFSATYTATVDSNSAPVLDPIGDQLVDEQVLLAFTISATDPDTPLSPKVSDSFTEAGSTPITAHTPDIGSGWTEVYDTSSATTDATIDPALDVVNGGSDENNVGQAYTAEPAPGAVDQSISFELSALDTTNGTKPVGVFGRRVDNNNFYYLQVLPNTHSLDSVKLFKLAAGTATELGTIDIAVAAGDTFELEITDATKKVFRNGSELLSSTDNALTASGTWGLYFGDFANPGCCHLRSTWAVDDFLAKEPGDTLTFSAIGLPTGASLDSVTGDFAWTPTEAQGPGVYPVTFVVTDDGTPNLADSEAINITVNETNVAPVANAGGPYGIGEGDPVTLDGSASSDADGDPLTYAWDLDNDTFYDDAVGVSPTINWATLVGLGLDDNGSYPVALEVNDGTTTHTTSATINIANTSPTISVTGSGSANPSQAYTVNLSVTDPGADTVASWTINWGDGSIDSIAGNPTTANHTYAVSRSYNVTAAVTDEDGTFMDSQLQVADFSGGDAEEYDGNTGAQTRSFPTPPGGPAGIAVGPDRLTYVSGYTANSVARYNSTTGLFFDTFVTPASGGLNGPAGLAWTSDGDLLVTSYGTDSVKRYDGSTGSYIGDFVAASAGGVDGPVDLTWRSDGDLFVSGWLSHTIVHYDGTTGAFIEAFAPPTVGSGTGLAFGPDGDLYVGTHNGITSSVDEYDGATGASLGTFITTLSNPWGVAWGPDGNLWVSSDTVDVVNVYDPAGVLVRTHSSSADGLDGPWLIDFSPDHQVLVAASVVNSTGDAGDTAPGDGQCTTGGVNISAQPECTLRAAIEEANALAGDDAIMFDIPAADPGYNAVDAYWTIAPASALPSIDGTTVLDATTQPGWASTPVIELDGTSAGATADGFRVSSANSSIRGFAINRFGETGIVVTAASTDTTIAANHIGLDPSGLVDRGNGTWGINLQSGSSGTTVGGTTTADRNVISGNGNSGTIVWGSDDNVIIGNYFGTDVSGNTALANTGNGIDVGGGSTNNTIGQPGSGNVMSGNASDGIGLRGSTTGPNTVQANLIGLGADGTTIVSNSRFGLTLFDGANNTQIGGPGLGEGNVISGNTSRGIQVDGNSNPATTANAIEGNIIGLDASGTFGLGNGSDGIRVFDGAHTNTIGGIGPGEGNTLAYNASDGIQLNADAGVANTIRGNSIYSNTRLGIDIVAVSDPASGVTPNDALDIDSGPNLRQNWPTLSSATVSGASTTVVGTLASGATTTYTIDFYSSPAGDPSGNGEGAVYLGSDTVLTNGAGDGAIATILPVGVTTGHVVSATATDAGGNTSEFGTSVVVTSATAVVNSTADTNDVSPGDDLCNTGGTNSDGDIECTLRAAIEEANASSLVLGIDFAIPASDPGHVGGVWTMSITTTELPAIMAGVDIDARTQPGFTTNPVVNLDGSGLVGTESGFVVGGGSTGSTIAGFAVTEFPGDGMLVLGDGTSITDNYLGVWVDGTTAAGNDTEGIVVAGSASGTLIRNNLIGDHFNAAVVATATSTDTVITGNTIGTDASLTMDLGNGQGIWADTTGSATVGGTGGGDGNIIRNSTFDAVELHNSGPGIAVLGNDIIGNVGHGIDLEGDGVTANDSGDGDSGANDLLNFPEIVSIQRVAGDLVVDYTLDAPAGNYRIELFGNSAADATGYGEGETFLGSGTIAHTGSGAEAFTLSVTSAATILTATATEDLGSGSFGPTSEFSLAVPSPDLVIVNSTGDSTDSATGDGQCDTGGTNSEGDPECTLRAAIQEANDGTTPVDTVWFAIPVTDPGHLGGVWTMVPTAPLPAISTQITIDGSTQPGYVASPIIQIDGGLTPVGTDGIATGSAADGSTIRGLAIVGFPDDGIEINNSANGITLVDNYIGVNADGVTTNGNGDDGISNNGAASLLIADNTISDNTNAGIQVEGTGTVVSGNKIGVGGDGLTPMGNGDMGIYVNDGATSALIGGTTAAAANIIANNASAGIVFNAITPPDDIAVLRNVIHSNGSIGIDLDDDAVTANDSGDGDSGANDLLNFPVISSAYVVGATVTVNFDLDTVPGNYRIEIFTNPSGADPTGYGEGETFETSYAIVAHPGGTASYTTTYSGALGDIVTATTTEDLGAGNFGSTSEFSGVITAIVSATAGVTDQTVRRSDALAAGGLDPTASVAGAAGPALAFDGVNDRLIGPGIDITSGSLTMSGWVNLTAMGTDPRIVAKTATAGSTIYELLVDSATNEAVARVKLGATTYEARGGTVNVASWHMVSATWDGADLLLYVDGSQVDAVPATGALDTDVAVPLTIGNIAAANRGLSGSIDHAQVQHRTVSADETAAHYANVNDPSAFVQVGAEQTSTPNPWTVGTAQSRSGSYALEAPETSGPDAAAWAVATGIDEPGVVFESWWWFTTDTGVDIAGGTRAGVAPTDQFEASLNSSSGWELRQRQGGTETVDAAAAGTPATGTWVQVEVWTDQNGESRILIDGVQTTAWTSQGGALTSGSVALRAGALPLTEDWYIDDAQARKLVIPEPLTTLGPLDRN